MKFSEIAERTAVPASRLSMGTKGKPEVNNAVRVASALTSTQVSKRTEFLTKQEERKQDVRNASRLNKAPTPTKGPIARQITRKSISGKGAAQAEPQDASDNKDRTDDKDLDRKVDDINNFNMPSFSTELQEQLKKL